MNTDKSPKVIKNMFDSIAEHYDKMNNVISFGMDKIIKKKCIKFLGIGEKSTVLDLCTGTGDLVKIIQALRPKTGITAVDFSKNMLAIAKNQIKNAKFLEADATNLPFEDNTFDFVTISYGLRNIQDRAKAISEIYRVLKVGGKILHLDFGEKNLLGKTFEYITPNLARIFGRDVASYKYLIESKKEFPEPNELIKEFEAQKFKLVLRKDFLLKSISAQFFEK